MALEPEAIGKWGRKESPYNTMKPAELRKTIDDAVLARSKPAPAPVPATPAAETPAE